MPSSQPERAADVGALSAIAQRLCGEPVQSVQACRASGNNRVYRIQTRHALFALKTYGSVEGDDRDRLGHEFDGLRFVAAADVGAAVPAAIAVDRPERCALYAWIDGEAVVDHDVHDITAALDLAASLHRARQTPGAEHLPAATEAVFTAADLIDQIERRIARLASVAPGEPELAAFLAAELRPEFVRRASHLSDGGRHAVLDRTRCTLSPSDFGFHNALRGPDGSLTFIDFEYFGWDDPVKLAADFLWHPGMRLSAPERRAFLEGVTALYGLDPSFAARLYLHFPLYGIRWCLIILNEFVPQLWARRAFAGKGGDWEAAKSEQLTKARATLAAVRSYREGEFG